MLEPELRRRGCGNGLMDAMLAFCREKGHARVFLLAITAQAAARHIYERRGFHRVWSREKPEWGAGIVEERWELEL